MQSNLKKNRVHFKSKDIDLTARKIKRDFIIKQLILSTDFTCRIYTNMANKVVG